MPGSTSLGFPYPVSSDTTNVPGDVQALADSVDTYLVGLDTGWQTCTLLSGTTGSLSARRIGDIVYLKGSLVRSDYAAGSYVAAATLPSSTYQPAADTRVPVIDAANSAVQPQMQVRIAASSTSVTVGATGTATVPGTVYVALCYAAT